MARVVVIGGGFGGMAAAARLAKLGHEVTPDPGALGPTRWRPDERRASTASPGTPDRRARCCPPSSATCSASPAARSSASSTSSRSTWSASTASTAPSLQLPGGSRAAQVAAVNTLGPGLGQQWVNHVATYGDAWELLRKEWFERPYDDDVAPRELSALLDRRESLQKRLRRDLRDERLRLVAGHRLVMDGHELRDVPVFAGVNIYLEQRFGAWTVPGGLAALGTAMADRLELRGVTVLTGTPATDLSFVRDGGVVAVATHDGTIDADRVVVAIDPRRVPALASYVRRTMPAIPPVVCHIGLEGEVPELPHEGVVLHGDPLLVVRTGGRAPDGGTAWTVLARGRIAEDVLTALAREGLDVRRQVVSRIDRSPRDLVEAWGGSPHGMLWQGPRAPLRYRYRVTPIAGVLTAGAHATTGSGLPFAGLSAALVADVIGRA